METSKKKQWGIPFKPGQSGNPKGRPLGIKDRRTIYREMVEPHREELLKKAIEMALSGDQFMLRLILDRVLPARPKDNPLPDNLPDLGDNVEQQCDTTLKLLTSGTITPLESNAIMDNIILRSQMLEMKILKERLDVLEKKN